MCCTTCLPVVLQSEQSYILSYLLPYVTQNHCHILGLTVCAKTWTEHSAVSKSNGPSWAPEQDFDINGMDGCCRPVHVGFVGCSGGLTQPSQCISQCLAPVAVPDGLQAPHVVPLSHAPLQLCFCPQSLCCLHLLLCKGHTAYVSTFSYAMGICLRAGRSPVKGPYTADPDVVLCKSHTLQDQNESGSKSDLSGILSRRLMRCEGWLSVRPGSGGHVEKHYRPFGCASHHLAGSTILSILSCGEGKLIHSCVRLLLMAIMSTMGRHRLFQRMHSAASFNLTMNTCRFIPKGNVVCVPKETGLSD